MSCAILCLLLLQAPAKPEGTLWTFKAGQELFVEETQRHLLQVNGPTAVSSFLDYTYLWRYFVLNESKTQVKIQTTLEKVRVNNPNEAGAKATEALKLHEGTKSTWLLNATETGWAVVPMPDEKNKHAPPYFLTLGTSQLLPTQDSWKQQWKVPVADWGSADLLMNLTIKQRTNDHIVVNVRAQLDWPKDNAKKLTFQPKGSSIAGLGECDLKRGRWYSFEYRLDGTWLLPDPNSSISLKQDSYCSYRYSERRPTFP